MNPINHVAIIMDGNGRWGLKNKNSRNLGHKEGIVTIQKIIKSTIKHKIKYLTLFTFSIDNWKRPKKEVSYIFKLLENFLKRKIDYLNKNKIKINFFGEKIVNKKLNKLIKKSQIQTKLNNNLQLNIAINYGSKQDIINSVKKLIKQKKEINEKNISNNLYLKLIPDPEIIIRTGNTKRLSNFLLWQSSYSEIFFEKKLWPDFNEDDFSKIINKFKLIKRNFGNI